MEDQPHRAALGCTPKPTTRLTPACCSPSALDRRSGGGGGAFFFVVFDGDDLVDGDLERADFVAQTATGDAQHFGRLRLVAAGMIEHSREKISFKLGQRV